MKTLRSIALIIMIIGTGKTASADDARSPCDSPALFTCSEYAAACVAYSKNTKALPNFLRDKDGNAVFDANSCAGWKNECLKTRLWQGPNCVIVNVEAR
jgi:hypothetical protein